MNDNLDFAVAQLIDHFHLTPEEIGRLTRVQIFKLYFWKRDEYGSLSSPKLKEKPKEQPATNADKLKMLKILKQHFQSRKQKCHGVDEAIQKLTAET